MAIHAPGRISRGLPRFNAPTRRRTTPPSISMTSMIDVMVVLTVFLLLTFSPSDACGCIERPVRLPSLDNGIAMIDAPMVTVSGESIALDGAPVEAIGLFEARRVGRIDDLFSAMKRRRALASQLTRTPPSAVVLKLDVDVPAYVVKSVVQTSALAGYPNVSFMGEGR